MKVMKKRIRNKNKNSDHSMAHVLYQKLGNDWYAFADVDGDCFMTKVDSKAIDNFQADEQELEKPLRKSSKNSKAA